MGLKFRSESEEAFSKYLNFLRRLLFGYCDLVIGDCLIIVAWLLSFSLVIVIWLLVIV
jgi:hypothetical protein